jgi:hypothetical protein
MAPPPKRQSLDAMAVLNLGLRFIGANDRERDTTLTTRITRFSNIMLIQKYRLFNKKFLLLT